MSKPASNPISAWFDVGYAVFRDGPAGPHCFPPLDDSEAQRHWLGVFGAAWVECPDEKTLEAIRNGNWLGGESVEEALVRVLAGRDDLLRQLWVHGLGRYCA
ncbi:MAG: histidine kinase [Chromatiaceae bacterium]